MKSYIIRARFFVELGTPITLHPRPIIAVKAMLLMHWLARIFLHRYSLPCKLLRLLLRIQLPVFCHLDL
jgi:hypothetical protein